jgi:Tfp pilus assembly protein PilO
MKNSTAFILLLISVGLFYTFISPQWQEVQGLKAEAATFSNALDNVHTLVAKRDQLLAQYKNIPVEQIDQLQKILPNNVDTVNLALDLSTVAALYGISIKTVETSSTNPVSQDNSITASAVDGTTVAPYQTVFVTFTFTSTYENFRKLLNDLEKSLRILDVQEVTFKTGINNLYDYRVSIETYWTK